MPLSVWLMNEHTELAIFEAGISEMGEMEALQTIIKPTVGILTNRGGAHQENFFSLQDKCMEKLTLFKDCDAVSYTHLDVYKRQSISIALVHFAASGNPLHE